MAEERRARRGASAALSERTSAPATSESTPRLTKGALAASGDGGSAALAVGREEVLTKALMACQMSCSHPATSRDEAYAAPPVVLVVLLLLLSSMLLLSQTVPSL